MALRRPNIGSGAAATRARTANASGVDANVFITEQLAARPSPSRDYFRETLALQDLARQMVESPDSVLPRLVDIAIEMCGAISGGLSLYEPDPTPGVFRWHHLRGGLEKFNGATTPRDFSPCGVTLDMKAPVLVERPERMYTWLAEANVSLPECLLVPLYIGGVDPLGTIWIVSEKEGHFHASHAEVLLDLAAFTGIAVRMARNERQLKATLDQQETLTREMSHRIQNLFAITDALIRGSSRTAATPQELAESLSGRLHALSAAHGLVRRSFDGKGADKDGTDLEGLIKVVLKPYEHLSSSRIEGPEIPLRSKSTNALALVLNRPGLIGGSNS